MSPDLRLVALGAGHRGAVLEFEVANRQWFSRFIGDRGDEWFQAFDEEFAALLDAQRRGEDRYHLLVDGADGIAGRFNLYRIEETGAEVGYRVAEAASGRGVATEGVRQLCRVAARDLGLTHLLARTSVANAASQRVLVKAGFALTGPCEVAGKAGAAYELELGAA